MIKHSLTTLAFLFTCHGAFADDFTPALENYLKTNISHWASDPILIDALRDSNTKTADFDAARINELDQAWQTEVGTPDTPLIATVITHPASDFLRQQMAASEGVIAEVFIMDQTGLNVAATSVTSDMWQGDEAKFIYTYDVGAGAIHISDVEFDDSSQAYLAQISISIADPETGDLLGAMTVGLNAETLF